MRYTEAIKNGNTSERRTKMVKGHKIRLFPTKEQEKLFYKHIGSCRFIYNWGLETQIRQYQETGKKFSSFELIKQLTPLKKQDEYGWLNEVSNASLQTSLRDLDSAYQRFLSKQNKFPKFKSRKKSKLAYPIRSDKIYFQDDKLIFIEKVGKVKYKTNYDVPIGKGVKFLNPRISLINNKWILSVSFEVENQEVELADESMGIDLGVKELAIMHMGNENMMVKNINKSPTLKRRTKKLKRLQRKVSRKYHINGNWDKSQNILKLEDEIRELQYHISMTRKNYLHQTTRTFVNKYPYRVVMEDLNVLGMMKNKHLSRAIAEENFCEFIRQMKYKCEELGIEFIQVGRWFPSSKTCSCCGSIKKDLKLKDRIYKCPECGLEIDRDINAAINLSQYVVG